MRGTVLGYDAERGTGAINDLSGGRLRFSRDAWRSPGEPVPGRLVDFEVADGEAIDIFVVPGSGPLDLSGSGDPAKSAMTWGLVSIGCALAFFILPHFGPLFLIPAIFFGLKGKNLGRDLPDKTGYYFSIAGLFISAFALLSILLLVAGCAAIIGMIGLSASLGGWN